MTILTINFCEILNFFVKGKLPNVILFYVWIFIGLSFRMIYAFAIKWWK